MLLAVLSTPGREQLTVLRYIAGLHQDDAGAWVAELDCLHSQHVRHGPPFQVRPWVLTGAGPDEHLGTEMDCWLCDRAELPAGLAVVRTAGPFDQDTIPAGLRRDHGVTDGGQGGQGGLVTGHDVTHSGRRGEVDAVVAWRVRRAVDPDDRRVVGLEVLLAGETTRAALAAARHEELSRLRVRFGSLWAELPSSRRTRARSSP